MAEVKVRITAQNQTQTGFQSVLNDAKKSAAQVKQTFAQAASTPSGGGAATAGGSTLFGPNMTVDDWVAQAERNIEENMKKRKALRDSMRDASNTAADTGATDAPAGGGMLRWGAIISAAAGAGLFLKQKIDEVGKAFISVTDNANKFSESLSSIGQADSVQELVSGLRSANAQFESIKQQADEFKSSLTNNIANLVSLGSLFGTLDEQVASAGREKALNAELSLARQLKDLREQTAAIEMGGNVDDVRQRQQQDQMREALRMSLEGNSPRFIQRQLARFDDVMAAQEEFRQAQRDQERDKQNEEKAKKSARIDQDIRIKKARASGDNEALQQELMRQEMTSALESGATIGQAKDLAAIEAAVRAQKEMESQFKGSQGASAFQRVGLATNEFFDTRSNRTNTFDKLYKEMQITAKALVQIEKKVKDGDLILASSSR
jgi:hypothetical protein